MIVRIRLAIFKLRWMLIRKELNALIISIRHNNKIFLQKEGDSA